MLLTLKRFPSVIFLLTSKLVEVGGFGIEDIRVDPVDGGGDIDNKEEEEEQDDDEEHGDTAEAVGNDEVLNFRRECKRKWLRLTGAATVDVLVTGEARFKTCGASLASCRSL